MANLTNGQAFSHTIDLTVNASTAATTFTPKAEFFESNGTNIGPQTGPLITAHADLELTPNSATANAFTGLVIDTNFVNNGPDAAPVGATLTVTISRSGLDGFLQVGGHGSISTCTTSDDEHAACAASTAIASGYSEVFETAINVQLVALGSYTITTTVGSPADPDTTNNTVTTSCNVVTAILINCTQA